ncbi:hypothetical protein LEP1GSC052_1322 [Leptospira kmetyi serovar Malaysia str. Bejo-Iso9]|nr:hypothetical protein LEP1GSC052_1322 [Leptospira kmetyi serovar Malaysia str. Bejo-Iso9]
MTSSSGLISFFSGFVFVCGIESEILTSLGAFCVCIVVGSASFVWGQENEKDGIVNPETFINPNLL